jgi:hypothetical protein
MLYVKLTEKIIRGGRHPERAGYRQKERRRAYKSFPERSGYRQKEPRKRMSFPERAGYRQKGSKSGSGSGSRSCPERTGYRQKKPNRRASEIAGSFFYCRGNL